MKPDQGNSPMITDTYTRNMCVCGNLQSEIVMDTNTQLLHTIVAKLDNLDTRMCAIEAQGERHEFVQPTKVVKTKSEPVVQSGESKAHHEMKASLKAMPKAKQRKFSSTWVDYREAQGWGRTGSIPKDSYYVLQAKHFASIA